MKLGQRVALQFIIQLVIVVVCIISMLFVMAYGIFYILVNDEQDLLEWDPGKMVQRVAEESSIETDQIKIPSQILRHLQRKKYWIQVLDEQGNEIYQQRKPTYISNQMDGYTLVTYRSQKKTTFDQVYTWYEAKENGVSKQVYTFIIGVSHKFAPLLRQIEKEVTITIDQIHVPLHIEKRLLTTKSSLMIYDSSGKELYSYRRPDYLPEQMNPGRFVKEFEDHPSYLYQSRKIGDRKITYVLRTSKNDAVHWQKEDWLRFMYPILGFSGLLISVAIIALLFGRKIGQPVLHGIQWIELLQNGIWQEPCDKRGVPKSINPKTGKIRRNYRIFAEMIQTLRLFTQRLKQNEVERNQLEKTRDEWIAGVSHDMKTPLSSVKGYADLLAEPSYDWRKEEVHKYANIIRDKAIHMECLIEDLQVTFRLKNDALPLQKEQVDLLECIRQSVIEIANSPTTGEQEIEFITLEQELNYVLDPKWFRRAIENLIGNASFHNPKGTKIVVTIGKGKLKENASTPKYEGVWITIEDNGRGMDEQTVQYLFERYYRGTNTANKGTGTGLGMAIAQQLIEAHKGKIMVESKLGIGTKLTICLP